MDSKRLLRRIKYFLLKVNNIRLFTFGYQSDIPERNILLGYMTYMMVGFGLLLLPWSTKGEVDVIDNLFTAVSAVSTTGLATIDIGESYTLFGQGVIILLIQLGAIGYMTMSSYIIFRLTHHSMNYSAKVIKTTIQVPYGMSLHELVNNVVHFTLIIEAIGFVALTIFLSAAETPMAAWNALFLSVSSFGTAGFSLFSDNLCLFSDNIGINLTIAFLSYSGAMGFIVITDLRNKVRKPGYCISFTTKVILLITAIMTLAGTLTIYFSPMEIDGYGWFHKLMVSFFQTMSAMTTVGFNTMNLSGLHVGPILILSLIMFVGASPSGTGGGVKCTSVSAVWGYIMAKLGLRDNVTFLHRTIPSYRVDSALTNVIAYGAMIFAGCVALSYSEPFGLGKIVFEATSALGTVGLSTGITPELSPVGKIAIISLMYIGRVGVITFGSALVIRAGRRKCENPSRDLVA